MSICQHCNKDIEDEARFCPSCGKAAGTLRAPYPPEVAALLTSANLHRLASEWDEAVADLSAALRLDPNNAEVASLMASVYEQRADLDEAAVWGKIAAELEPENPVYQSKLQRITEQIAATRGRRAPRGKQPQTLQTWYIAGGVVVLALLMVIVAIGMMRGPSRPGPRQQVESKAAIPKIITPESRVSVERRQAGRPAQSLSGGDAGASGSKTPAEIGIQTAVSGVQSAQEAGVQVSDVMADPRRGVVVISFSMPTGPALNKSRILMASAALARAAFGSNSQVAFVTARCLITPAGSRTTQLAFMGDITRQMAEGLPDGAPLQQYQASFTGAWWNPQIN